MNNKNFLETENQIIFFNSPEYNKISEEYLYKKYYNFKILLLGDSNVGKTTFLKSIKNEISSENHYLNEFISTIGNDFCLGYIYNKYKDYNMKMKIWDTAGKERFRSISNMFLHNCSLVYLFFDVTNVESFNNIQYWLTQLNEKNEKEFVIILISTKYDFIKGENLYNNMGEIVNENDVLDLVSELNNCYYFKCSIHKNNESTAYEQPCYSPIDIFTQSLSILDNHKDVIYSDLTEYENNSSSRYLKLDDDTNEIEVIESCCSKWFGWS